MDPKPENHLPNGEIGHEGVSISILQGEQERRDKMEENKKDERKMKPRKKERPIFANKMVPQAYGQGPHAQGEKFKKTVRVCRANSRWRTRTRHEASDDGSTALVSRASKDKASKVAQRKRSCSRHLPRQGHKVLQDSR